jgi:hypothetical protein
MGTEQEQIERTIGYGEFLGCNHIDFRDPFQATRPENFVHRKRTLAVRGRIA